jgi:DNA-binding MarR family transcriptional regulator
VAEDNAGLRYGFRDPDGPGAPGEATPNVGWLMKECVYYARKAVDDAVRPHGVSVSQWALLYQLAERPGLSGAELAREMLITPQAVHQLLTTLQWMGLIERKADPNHARIYRSVLTEDGRRVADRCRAETLRIQRALVEGFDDEERKVLVELLDRFLYTARSLAD